MVKKNKLKIIMYLNILILLFLISYKGYLLIYETDFESKNIDNIEKIQAINQEDLSFAVFGNIQSSISIFDKDIVRDINNDPAIDFTVSNGDAILDGFEDKYRILNKSINKINVPTIVGVGDKEITNDGDESFYRHFGPYYFSFEKNDNYFIFLDTSGKTSQQWQKKWLLEQLKKAQNFEHTFVFMNHSPVKLSIETHFDDEKNYITDEQYQNFLMNNFSKYNVTTVFSSVAGIFSQQTIDGVDYIISGAAGGTLVTDEPNSFYHYIKVNINDSKISYDLIKIRETNQSIIGRMIENIWIYIYSVFYINYLNFIIILGILILIIIAIYKKASKDVNYYRDFEALEEVNYDQKLDVLMITNNYLPFIGGVPISINRLKKGLEKRGHQVTVVAPRYPDLESDESDVIRINLLKYYESQKFKFPIPNIFSKKFKQVIKESDYDVIHVHHPFWMGARGLRLGLKYDIPVILTYHTRLEQYAHFIPVFKLVFKNIISHKMIKNFAQKCHAIISPTYTAKEYLNNIGISRKKYVIPTGINFEAYQFKDDAIETLRHEFVNSDEKLLCTVSRLSNEKNLYFMLEAINYIKYHSDIKFKHIIIGDGGEKERMQAYIDQHDLNDVVKLIGQVPPDQIPKYYLAADLFVFSSLSETQGMVILEAMAGACPVVAVRASGIDDIIENKYNGFKTKNKIEDWANKVMLLMNNEPLFNEMKQNALHYAKNYSLEAIAKDVEEVYYTSIHEKTIFKD